MGAQTVYAINTEGNIYQEYQITAGASASAAQLLSFQTQPATGTAASKQIVVCSARGDNIVFKFGDNTVVADKTVSANALAAGNFSIEEGAIYATDINGITQSYVSVQAEGAGGTAIIRLTNSNL